MSTKKSPAYKKGHANAFKAHYWEHTFEADKARFKSAATRAEFERGYYDGLAEKYKLPAVTK